MESGVRQGRRSFRYDGLQALWKLSTLRRVRMCRRVRSGDAPVTVVVNGDVAHLKGLQTCGSVHACPVCGPAIRARRATEIEAGTSRHLEGGGAEFVTLTMPHDQGDELEDLWAAVSLAWKRVLSGRGWIEDRDSFGVVGTIRAVELTYGENGWHVHLHVLVLTEWCLDEAQRRQLRRRISDRWSSSIVASGYRAPADYCGVTISAVTGARAVAEYTSKVFDEVGRPRALGNELTRHDLKEGRRKGRNPFKILADFLESGESAELDLWHTYEAVSVGKKSLAWSKGLKALLLVQEESDEEIAAEVVGGADVFELTDPEWARVAVQRGGPAGLLLAVELGGAVGGYRFLSGLDPPGAVAA